VLSLLGADHPELGEQVAPDPEVVVAWLRAHDLVLAVQTAAAEARAAGAVWPAPPPYGLSPAQFLAALHRVRAELNLLGTPTVASPPAARRGPDPEERRLRADIPPHHGLL